MAKQSSLTIVGILANSLKTTLKNGKFVLLVMPFLFFSLCFLVFGSGLVYDCMYKDVYYRQSVSATHQNYIDPIQFEEPTTSEEKILLLVDLGVLVLLAATSLLFAISVISSTSSAYIAKILTLNDTVLWVREKWNAAFMTNIYMCLISIGVFVIYVFSLALGSVLTDGFGSSHLKLGASILLGIVCSVYLTIVWVVSLVVSVVKDKCGGIKAIVKAKEMLKGKWVKACILVLLILITVSGAIYMNNYVLFGKLGTKYGAGLIVRILGIWSYCLGKFFLFVVCTVFYHECENSGKDEEDHKLGVYLPIASGDV